MADHLAAAQPSMINSTVVVEERLGSVEEVLRVHASDMQRLNSDLHRLSSKSLCKIRMAHSSYLVRVARALSSCSHS